MKKLLLFIFALAWFAGTQAQELSNFMNQKPIVSPEIGAKEALDRGKKSDLLSILVKPFWKFIRDYFVKMGFLDGYYGFVICMISAHATFLKYIKLKELKQNSSHDAS